MIAAIVLAAGTSSRMGKANKLLLDFRGKPLIRHTLEQLALSSVDKIWVVTGYEEEKVRKVLDGMDVEIVHNPRFETGMSSSVKKGVDSLPENVEAFMVCLSDMPLLEAGEYDLLIQAYREAMMDLKCPIVIPRSGERPGNPVVFHPSYRTEVLAMEDGPFGCKPVVKRHKKQHSYFSPPSDHYFLDMDKPEDYQRILREGNTPLKHTHETDETADP
jgi:molybdenum cofactor cytidylyltransferase